MQATTERMFLFCQSRDLDGKNTHLSTVPNFMKIGCFTVDL